jgi:hypothetical protein
MEWILGGLIVVLFVMGVSSALGSYADAQQAQAQIETARAAQMSAGASILSSLMALLVVLAVLAVIALGVWFWMRGRKASQAATAAQGGLHLANRQPNIQDLVALEILRTLREMRGENRPALPGPVETVETIPAQWMESLR